MAYTFNGIAKTITLSAGTVTLDLVDLHSRWKDWVLAGNSGYAQAFSTVGGDIPAIPLYLFLLNGWRIIPQSANHTLDVIGGILEVFGGGDPFVDPAGSYSIRITRQAPGIAIGYSTTGVAAPSAAENATAVLAAMATNPPPVNTVEIHGGEVIGSGTLNDPWRNISTARRPYIKS